MLLSLGLLVAFTPTLLAECPPDTIYETFFDKCYKYYNSPLPFLAAEKQCNSIGGNLVAVQSGFENSYVSGIASGASGRTPNFWFGANQLLSASWSWTYNTSMSYTNWAPGQPGAGYPCALIRDSDSRWISGACNSALPFVCSVGPNAPQPGYCPTQQAPPTCASSSCPDDVICSPGYTLFVGNCLCYKYANKQSTYSDAQIACANEGASLVKIDTPELNDFLTTLPGFDCGGFTCPWIGLTCLNTSQSSCTWPDGSAVTYTNYNGAPPGNTSYSSVLVTNIHHFDTGMWEKELRTLTYSILCQKTPTRSSLLKMAAPKNANDGLFRQTADRKN